MAQQMLSFIHSRAPRAAGVSDEAIDEHRELIRDLYLTQNYTREQVIAHLKTELAFNLSPDQFSKAIRRWGFRKQVHGNRSTQQPSKETAMQFTATDTTSNQLPCTADEDDLMRQRLLLTNNSSKHSRGTANSTSCRSNTIALGPSPLSCPSVKRPSLTSDLGDIDLDDITTQSMLHLLVDPDVEDDGDVTMSSVIEEKNTEPSDPYGFFGTSQLSAEYLACYRYTEAFGHYLFTSRYFYDWGFPAKKRRAIMLDMARLAETQRHSEIIRAKLEAELEMSNDPLAEKGHTQSPAGEAEMCRIQSFLFHCYLAQIYACRKNGAISMQKHLDNARNFTKTFDIHGPVSIDLWTLLFLVQEKTDSRIPEDVLGSLQWDYESYGLNVKHCLCFCWEILHPTKSIHKALAGRHESQRKRTELNETGDLSWQGSPYYLWSRSSILFTFLWEQIQLAHGTLPWGSGNPTISPALILMIVSRIIVKRSCPICKHNDGPINEEEGQLKIHPTDLHLYCDALLGLFHDNMFAPDETRKEFATHFVEHHTWSPPFLDPGSDLDSRIRNYPIKALKSVLAARRNNIEVVDLSPIVEERTMAPRILKEKGDTSMDSDLPVRPGEDQGQGIFPFQRPADNHIHLGRSPPTSNSPRNSSHFKSSITSHGVYLGLLKGNPTISRPLASHSSCSSQWSASSSLQRFKAAALSWKYQPEPILAVPEDFDMPMDHGLS